MTTKTRTFNAIGTTAPSATPTPPVAAPIVPEPQRSPDRTESLPRTVEVSKQVSLPTDHVGDRVTFSASDLIAGMPDPKRDLITFSVKLPRELGQTLDLEARKRRMSKQDVVADALYAALDPRLVAEVRRSLYPNL